MTESWNSTKFLPLVQKSDDEAVRLIGWDIPSEELVHVPDHWLKYPEPQPYLHYLLGSLYIVFTVMSLLGNGIVIWIFSTAKSLRTPSNIFIVNLAICDFIMMLKTPVFIYNSFHRGFMMGHLGCQIYSIMGAYSGIGASCSNAFIAYDRYKTIANPLTGKFSHSKVLFMVYMIWMYATPWALLPAFQVFGRFVPEGFLTSCTFDYLTDTLDTKVFVSMIFTCSYVIPMTFTVYFYSLIFFHVVQHEKSLKKQAKKMNVENLRANDSYKKQSIEIKIAKAAVTICFLFVASWTPYAVMALIGCFGNKDLLTPALTMIPACTCKTVACLDPYIYALSHPKFRLELNKRMPWLAIKEEEPSKDSAGDERSRVTETTAAPTSDSFM